MIHDLKTWPGVFHEVASGAKTFEIRYNDRNFQVGDLLLLREFDPEIEDYSGYTMTVRVTYILNLDSFLPCSGFVGMSIEEIALRRNPSGCCCKISEEGDRVIEACALHREWKEVEG